MPKTRGFEPKKEYSLILKVAVLGVFLFSPLFVFAGSYDSPARVELLDLTSGSDDFMLSVFPKQNNTAKFSLDKKVYELHLKGVSYDFATIEFYSQPATTIKILLREKKSIDLDLDGKKDISIQLDKIVAKSNAYFQIKKLQTIDYQQNKPVTQPSPSLQTESIAAQPAVQNPSEVVNSDVTNAIEENSQDILPVEAEDETVKELHENPSILIWVLPSSVFIIILGIVLLISKLSSRKKELEPVEVSSTQFKSIDQDDMDRFISNSLASGANFNQIFLQMQNSGWSYRDAYLRCAKFVVRSGLAKGKTPDEILDAMRNSGWDPGAAVTAINSELLS